MSLVPPYVPQPVDDLALAFPAHAIEMMPAMADIPEEFRQDRGDARPWIKFQQRWFARGLKGVAITAKNGVDKNTALRHLALIQGSYEPQHEHKEAAVAFLASLWLEPVSLPAARS